MYRSMSLHISLDSVFDLIETLRVDIIDFTYIVIWIVYVRIFIIVFRMYKQYAFW